MRFHVIFVMSFPQVALLAEPASIFSETFLSIIFVVERFHVTLIEDSPPELNVADAAHMCLLHVRFYVTSSS